MVGRSEGANAAPTAFLVDCSCMAAISRHLTAARSGQITDLPALYPLIQARERLHVKAARTLSMRRCCRATWRVFARLRDAPPCHLRMQ